MSKLGFGSVKLQLPALTAPQITWRPFKWHFFRQCPGNHPHKEKREAGWDSRRAWTVTMPLQKGPPLTTPPPTPKSSDWKSFQSHPQWRQGAGPSSWHKSWSLEAGCSREGGLLLMWAIPGEGLSSGLLAGEPHSQPMGQRAPRCTPHTSVSVASRTYVFLLIPIHR